MSVVATVPTPAPAGRRLLWAAFALAGVVLADGVWGLTQNPTFARVAPRFAEPLGAEILDMIGILVPLAAALVIIWQVRRHPVGWLLLGYVAVGAVADALEHVAALELTRPELGVPEPGAWVAVGQALERAAFGMILLIVLVFPTGRVPGPRWRWFPLLITVLFGLWFLTHVFQPGITHEDPFDGVVNPLGWAPLSGHALNYLFLPLAAATALLALLSLVLRFRRSRGDERQQLKWFGLAALVVPLFLAGVAVASVFGGTAGENAAGNVGDVALNVVLPAALVIAITRYRLYDLDLVVNRAVVYAAVCLALALAYLVVVLVADRVVIGAGWTTPWVVAAATLAACSVAGPARRRIQRAVDRTLGHRQWAARRRIQALAERADREPIGPAEVEKAVAEACSDPTLRIVYWLRDRNEYADGSGLPEPVSAGGPAGRSVSGAGGGPLARVRFGPALQRNLRLLDSVLTVAALLLENARLQAEANARLVEVQESRRRIVQAGDAARRRIERDLHDGAQQRLVALALQVRMAGRETSGHTQHLLEGIGGQVLAAIEELRDLARGVHPEALSEGLGPALETVVDRLPLPVRLDLPAGRMPESIELTCYFLACEAVTNALKHADAQQISVSGRRAGDRFTLIVADDGRGGATAASGSGLAGLVDRVSAVGGRLAIDSPAGAGTRITAELPCAS